MPDGRTLVFAGQTGAHAPTQLYLVNRDGTGLSQVTTTGATNPAPCADGPIIYSPRERGVRAEREPPRIPQIDSGQFGRMLA